MLIVRFFRFIMWPAAFMFLSACRSDSDQEAATADVEAEIAACYSHTSLSALPTSHPDFATSPAAAADGFEGTFQSDDGDILVVTWQGHIDQVHWHCEDRSDLPQTAGGATDDFVLPVTTDLSSADGQFHNMAHDDVTVRVHRPNPSERGTEVRTYNTLTPTDLKGAFAPTEGKTVGSARWDASYANFAWTMRLAAFEKPAGCACGIQAPIWTREIRFSRVTAQE